MLQIPKTIVIFVYMNLERFKSEIVSLRPKLFSFAYKMTEDKEEAEDSVQEALLRLWKMREQIDALDNPAGFAVQITKNICIDKLRIRKRTYNAEEYLIESNDNTPYQQTERENSVSIVKQIIESLPELQRLVIRMRDIEGYELTEIAEITGTDISAVRVNLSRARKKVKDRFISLNNYYQKQM